MIRSVATLVLLLGSGAAAAPASQSPRFEDAVKAQQQGNLPAARAAYEQILASQPDHLQSLANLGLLLLQQNEPGLAAERLARAVELQPSAGPVRFYFALSLFRANRFEEARRQLDTVLEQNPANAQAHHLSGLTLLKADRLDDGIAALEKALELDPANTQAAYTLGSAYVGRGLPAKAEALLAGPLGDQRSPEAHLLRGIILNTRSEWQAAVREIETALKSNPKLPSARAHLGHSLLLLGGNERAEAAFRSALEQDPEDFHANVYLGWIYLRDQRHADAAAPLAAAVRTKPDHPGLLYLLAQVRHASGDLKESAALLERAVESAPDFTPAHVLLARVYGKLNRKEGYLRHREIIAELNAAEQERNLRSQESYGEKESGALAGLASPAGSVPK